MATQITHAPFDPFADAVERFDKAVKVAVAACERGFRGKIAVSMSDVTGIGDDALDLFKQHLDHHIGLSFALTADPDADLVCIEPVAVSASMPSTEDATGKTKRPKNAFVIFRLHHHATVKDMYPGIHNNEISKIIGAMWRNASPEEKAEYKEKAEEEKRQHAIDHPGYKYQPRKPSEKKKRMTKNKLAKLAAQSSSTDATTNATALPAQQNGQTTVSTVTPPYQMAALPLFGGAEAFSPVLGLATDEQTSTSVAFAEQHRQEQLEGYADVDFDAFVDPSVFGVPSPWGLEGLAALVNDDA